MSGLRIVFAGTPEFALPALEALHTSGQDLVGVLTQPDRRAGRGRELRASPVKRRAVELNLNVFQPHSLRGPEIADTLRSLAPDLCVVVAYGLILPPAILALPRLGCVNVHASLLPRWRGAAPIQRAIIAGDTHTGVSIMQMEKGLDTGPVFAAHRTPIGPEDTGATLHARLAQLGAELLLECLPGIATQSRVPQPQDETTACLAPRIEKCEAVLDWSAPAAALERRVRAFNPWPVCETRLDGQQLRIWEAAVRTVTGGAEPGSVVATGPDGIDVATGEGVLRLTCVQLAGRKAVTASEFLNANPLDDVRLG